MNKGRGTSIFELTNNAKLNNIAKHNDYPSLVIFGDSITSQCGSFNNVGANNYWQTIGYFAWTQLRSNGHFNILKNAGIGGNTTAQMLARIQTDVLAYNPELVVVEGGINDIYTGVLATDTIANLQTIYDTLRGSGAKIVIVTVTPSQRIDTAGELANLAIINDWIASYAVAHKDVIFCDWYQCMCGTDGKNVDVRFTADGTHPNTLGAWRMGKKLFDTISTALALTTSNDFLSKSASSGLNLLTNGVLSGATAGKTTGWSFGANGTFTNQFVDDGVISYNEQLIASASAQTVSMYQDISTGFAIGDKVEALVRLKFENVTAITDITVMLSTGTTNTKALFGSTLTKDLVVDGVYRTPPIVIPAGTTTLTMFINMLGFVGTVHISNPTVRKVS